MGSSKKNGFFPDFIYCSLIFIIAVLISYPLFKGKYFIGFDYGGGLMLLLSMKLTLGHGQWLVRWVPGLLFGYGYPVFNFYPPLFSILGTAVTCLGAGILAAYNLSLFIVLFLSGCAMYLLAREFWGREGGFLSAIVYLFAPYHLFDIYVRAAAAESTSFIFLPLIMWSFYKLQKTALKRYVVFSAGSLAGLLLTHNCISVIFLPAVILYILFLYWPYSSYQRIKSALRGLGVFAIGIGLAAFFWLPAFFEKKFVKVYLLTQGHEDFHSHFLYLQGLVLPVWVYDMPWEARPAMSCQIGLVHALLALAVLLGIKKIADQVPGIKRQIVFFTVIGAGGVFATLTISTIIWEHISILQFVQFPSRFLTIVAFSGSVIAGGAVLLVGPRHRLIATIGLGLLISLANFSYCHPREFVAFDLGPAMADPDKLLSNLSMQDGGEYVPIGVKAWPTALPAQKLEALTSGDQILDSKQITPVQYKFKIKARDAAVFSFNSFYFPGWEVKVDGHKQKVLKDDAHGLVVFSCPEGVHEVEVYFGTTHLRQLAQGVSIAALALTALALL